MGTPEEGALGRRGSEEVMLDSESGCNGAGVGPQLVVDVVVMAGSAAGGAQEGTQRMQEQKLEESLRPQRELLPE